MAILYIPAYTSGQLMVARYILSGLVLASCAAFVCFWMASTGTSGRRKGKLVLAVYLLVGGNAVAFGSAFIYMQTILQTRHAIGEIVAVESLARQTDLLIRTSASDEISVRAPGRSPYFKVGRRLRIDYQENSGLLMDATFLSQAGEAVGVFRANPRWSAYFIVVSGVLLVYVGIRRYRLESKAIEVHTPRPNLAGAFVNGQSLLHLSATPNPSPELEE